MSKVKIAILPVLKDNYCFIISCLETGKIAAIDPANQEVVSNYLGQKKLDYILNTHHHYDHIGSNLALKKLYNCEIIGYAPDAKRIPGINIKLTEGQNFSVGKLKFEVIFVPGHTLGHICYFCAAEKILFCGDTLFSSGCGRVFEGTYDQMHDSLQKLAKLPKDTKIYCAHEYTMANLAFAAHIEPDNQAIAAKINKCQKLREQDKPTIPTNLADELETNPFLRSTNPALRKNLGFNSDHHNVAVFTKVRKLKDSF